MLAPALGRACAGAGPPVLLDQRPRDVRSSLGSGLSPAALAGPLWATSGRQSSSAEQIDRGEDVLVKWVRLREQSRGGQWMRRRRSQSCKV
jgi:hypothetical protein